jgi:hypothetical protein
MRRAWGTVDQIAYLDQVVISVEHIEGIPQHLHDATRKFIRLAEEAYRLPGVEMN